MKSKRIVWAFAILAVLCACRKNTTVPVEMIGVWKTSSPKYADRYFEITKNSIAFGTGERRIDSHPILGIEKITKEKDLYVILYSDGAQKSEFSFYFSAANNGVIRLKNQEKVQWTKERR